jgi:cytoskeleton protein RodZ
MDSIGQKLKAAREKKKMTISEVAKAMRVKNQYVEAIEHDQFHKLIAPVYARGFIKLYALSVGLDPTPLVRQFARVEFVTEAMPPHEPAPHHEKKTKRATPLLAGLANSISKIKVPDFSLPALQRLKIFQVPAGIWITVITTVVVVAVIVPLFVRMITAHENKLRLSPACRWLADPPEPYINIVPDRK